MNRFLVTFLFLNIFCLIRGENKDSDFFLQISGWEKPRKIDLQVHALKESDNIIEDVHENIFDLTLETTSGIQIPVTFYDRKSDVVLIAGQGLPAPKEAMQTHADLFSTYDVILFDYRWNGKYESFLAKSCLTCRPIKKILLDEVEEVQSIINFVKKLKSYKAVVGLGECYSNFLFAKIQDDAIKKDGKGPFTHLIFDSCWYSLRSLAERICFDPLLPLRPQTGGAPWLIKNVTDNKIFKWFALGIVFTLMNDISIESYLSSLNIPVLFIHGLNDLFVPKEHFDEIWNATNLSARSVFFTPYRHSDNLHNKMLYSYLSRQFVNSCSTKEFEDKCRDLIW